jgi:hypothetical protein
MKKFTILIAAIALVCFSVPAMAADWNFYGSARMQTTYISDNFKDTLNAAGTDDKDANLDWNLQSNTRFGARVKAEKLSGRMEFGVNEATITSRLLYGEWNFGGGKLLVGKDYSPGASQFVSSSIQSGRTSQGAGAGDDQNLLGFGAFYGGRNGQIKLSFGGFSVALIDSATTNIAANGDVDDYLPKVQAEWGMAFDTWNFSIAGGAQTFSIEDVVSGAQTDDIDVTSYFVSAMGAWNIGAFTLKPAVSYSQNGGNAGWTASAGTYNAGDNDIDDAKTFQGILVGVFRLSDMLAFEGGFGYRYNKTDANVAEDKNTTVQGYIQALWTMAPGVYLMPEIGYIDFGKNTADADLGNTLYAGAKWQIDF